MERWRGLKDLVQDAIDQGSTAVEQVHQQVARRTFDILEYVPPLAEPARRARLLQEAVIGGAYDAIRLVNRVVGAEVWIVPGCGHTPHAQAEDEFVARVADFVGRHKARTGVA